MVDTQYVFIELIHELVNVGMRSSFVGWNGGARPLGIPNNGIKEISKEPPF